MNNTNPSDFEQFFLTETSSLAIDTPNGEPMLYNGEPVLVHLHGPSTPQYTAAKVRQEKVASHRAIAALTKRPEKKDMASNLEADAEFLCAVTSHFENFPFPGGAEAIYREPRLKYINAQVFAHLADLGNFYKTSKTS